MNCPFQLGRFYWVDVLFRGDLLEVRGICEDITDDSVTLRPPRFRGDPQAVAVVIDAGSVVRVEEM